jgi:hypothetical protein
MNLVAGNNSLNVALTPVAVTYTLVVGVANSGSVNTSGGVYPPNTSITLIATPDTDWSFIRWSVGGAPVSNANPYTFRLNSNLTIIAEFQPNPPQLTPEQGEQLTAARNAAQAAVFNPYLHAAGLSDWPAGLEQLPYFGSFPANVTAADVAAGLWPSGTPVGQWYDIWQQAFAAGIQAMRDLLISWGFDPSLYL